MELLLARSPVVMELLLARSPVGMELLLARSPVGMELLLTRSPVGMELLLTRSPVGMELHPAKSPVDMAHRKGLLLVQLNKEEQAEANPPTDQEDLLKDQTDHTDQADHLIMEVGK